MDYAGLDSNIWSGVYSIWHLTQSEKIQKIVGYIDPQTVYVHIYVHTWEQPANSCNITVIGGDVRCLTALE